MKAQSTLLIFHSWSILLLKAQETPASHTDHWYTGSIGFAAPGEYACSDIESRPEYVWLTLTSNITNPGCHNIAEIFTEPSCNPNEPDCSVPFTTQDGENFDASANYSRVMYNYAQVWDRTETNVNLTELTLSAFDGADCAERDYAPYQWSGCEDDIEECTDLPFNVVSFYITGSEDANRTGDCLAGVIQGSGSSRTRALVGVVFAVSVLVGVVIM